MISVIVPCFNEREVLPAMYAELERVRKEDFCGVAEFEYIFVDDGSSDGTVGFIKELRRSDKRVRFISFSRNFGKEAAISAGLQAAKRGSCDAYGRRPAGSAVSSENDVRRDRE